MKLKWKKITIYKLLFIGILTCFWSCSPVSNERADSKPSPRIIKKVKIESPKPNEKKIRGETITFQLVHRDDQVAVDSVKFEYGAISETVSGDEYDLNTSYLRVGNPRIVVTAYYGTQKETLYPKVTLLAANEPTPYTFRIINEFPHDENAYTQGLFFDGDILIESTGDETSQRRNSSSSIRKVDLRTGNIIEQILLEEQYFGEGCTLWNNSIYQLTWTSNTVLIYDKDLQLQRTFQYGTEGWGLTTAGDTLVMTDGSENVYLMRPEDFSEIDRFQVYDHEGKVTRLNELEYFEGKLYANIYTDTKDEIIIIDIGSGEVTGRIDFNGIVDRSVLSGFDHAMNGTAWHKDRRLYVTGKWWPRIFEVEILPKTNS